MPTIILVTHQASMGRIVLPDTPPPNHYAAHYHHSVAYFCDCCGDIWARALSSVTHSAWSLYHVHCPRHNGGYLWHCHYNILPLSAFPTDFLRLILSSLEYEQGQTLAQCSWAKLEILDAMQLLPTLENRARLSALLP